MKQDRQGVRTAAQLEMKYNFGKSFAELLGLINDSREKVDRVESSVYDEISQMATSLTRDAEQIVMAALANYYTKTEAGEIIEKTVSSELALMANELNLTFESLQTTITNVDGDLQTLVEELEKHFEFTIDGLAIKAGAGEMQLLLDNDVIRFVKNGQEFGWWDGVDFHTGNIVVQVSERAQFGNFAFVPRTNGSLDFLKVDDYVAAAITKHPSNKTVGATYVEATFSVTAVGSEITYQWQTSTDVASWSNMLDSRTDSIRVSFTNTNIKKRYFRCVVTDSKGKSVTSNVAIFTLYIA